MPITYSLDLPPIGRERQHVLDVALDVLTHEAGAALEELLVRCWGLEYAKADIENALLDLVYDAIRAGFEPDWRLAG